MYTLSIYKEEIYEEGYIKEVYMYVYMYVFLIHIYTYLFLYI